MTVTRWTFAAAILALAALPSAAQEGNVRRIGAGLDESMFEIYGPDIQIMRDSSKGVLINDKGEILVPWRSVCISSKLKVTSRGGRQINAKVLGVHPSRDLAVIQMDLSDLPDPDKTRIKPAKLASSALGVGDEIMVWRSGNEQPVPAIVSSDTQPADHPEYFWMTGKLYNAPFGGKEGWGNQWPRPNDWVLNPKGEIQGMLARVLVNGTMVLRVIPLHDIQVEDFIAPSKRRTDPARAQELLTRADTIDREGYKANNNPWGWYGTSADYRRMALAEDPTNKDVLYKLGLTANDVDLSATGGGGGGASEPRKPADPAAGKSKEEVESEFVKSRVNAAVEMIKSNQLKIAQSILQDVVDTFPKHPEAKTAQRLLDVLKGKK
jgi:hypothetical protein